MQNKICDKKNKGITLVSLVITIVIMLILATVSISFILGQNGIFNKATKSKEMYQSAGTKEMIENALSSTQLELYENNEEYNLENIKNVIGKYDSNIKNLIILDDHIEGKYNSTPFQIVNSDENSFEVVLSSNNKEPENVAQKTFNYTGNYEEYDVLKTGTYKIELWGASGGTIASTDLMDETDTDLPKIGYGAYTSGEIYLEKGTILYFYVGQSGQDKSRTVRFNGGGYGGKWSTTTTVLKNDNGYAGGGATDVRIVSGDWKNFDSLKSRIMVAAGGGGSNSGNKAYCRGTQGVEGSFAGGLTGYEGCRYSDGYSNYGKGGTQITFGASGNNIYSGIGTTVPAGFGFGGSSDTTSSTNGAGGGGSGYYGGGAGAACQSGGSGGGGGGGSSFISGHQGCNAVTEASTETNIIASGTPNFYDAKYVFSNTKMIDGKGYEWTTTKQSQVQMPGHEDNSVLDTFGNAGDGFAKITFEN